MSIEQRFMICVREYVTSATIYTGSGKKISTYEESEIFQSRSLVKKKKIDTEARDCLRTEKTRFLAQLESPRKIEEEHLS